MSLCINPTCVGLRHRRPLEIVSSKNVREELRDLQSKLIVVYPIDPIYKAFSHEHRLLAAFFSLPLQRDKHLLQLASSQYLVEDNIQSSYPNARVSLSLAYIRTTKRINVTTKLVVHTATATLLRESGCMKLGVTPGGGCATGMGRLM